MRICAYMYMRIYVCMHRCTDAYNHTEIYEPMCGNANLCMYIYIYTHVIVDACLQM